MDSDLAATFGVETKAFNQAVKCNEKRLDGYAFQLTNDEFRDLKSQNVTSKSGRGGRRYPPWMFTEHGVVMVATLLNSDGAVVALKFIIETFVAARHANLSPADLVPVTPSDAVPALQSEFIPKLKKTIHALMESKLNPKDSTTVREEAEQLVHDVLGNL